MNFAAAVSHCFRNYITFSGRASRSEFWWFTLFIYGVMFVLSAIDMSLFGETQTVVTDTSASVSSETEFSPLASIFGIVTVLPYISVTVRRLHDTDRSGWWYWLALIPLIGIIVLIVWFATKGSDGPNRFGEDPLTTR